MSRSPTFLKGHCISSSMAGKSLSMPGKCCASRPICRMRPLHSRIPSTWTSLIPHGRIGSTKTTPIFVRVRPSKREGSQVDLGLKNRSVIVAASSDGIARAAAEKFAAEGAKVAMCSRNEGKLSAAADAIRKRYSAEVIAAPLDVTDEAAVQSFVERVGREFGSVDVCVTNAGGPPAKMFLSTTTDEWHRAVELNF